MRIRIFYFSIVCVYLNKRQTVSGLPQTIKINKTMKRKKDLKKRLAPTVKVSASTGIFWNPMEAAILGVEMGMPVTDDWLD